MSLLSHTDTVRVSEDIVRAEPRPDFTSTWRPFSHGEIIDAVQSACDDLSLSIVRKEYSIRKDSKMFASWEIAPIEAVKANYKEMQFSIGIRNSIDKTHSVGFCAGKRVFVCDNLVFSGDFVIFRKHTGALELGEILILAKESLQALIPKFKELEQWHNRMKKIRLTDEQAALLACAAMKKELIPASKYPNFHKLYFEKDTKYTATLHGFHGACTELMMSNSLLTIQWKNDQLNRFLNFETQQLLSPRKVARVDFIESAKIAELHYEESRKKEKELARATSQQIRKKAIRKLKEQKRKEIPGAKGRIEGKRPKPKGKAPKPTAPPPRRATLKKKRRAEKAQKEIENCQKLAAQVPKKTKKKILKSIADEVVEKQAEKTVKNYHAIADALANRARKEIKERKKKAERKLKAFVMDDSELNASYTNNLKHCPYCKTILAPKDKSCHHCGEAI